MKKILMWFTSFAIIFNSSFLTSCNLFKPKIIYVEEKLNVSNNNIDLDCNEPLDDNLYIEAKNRDEATNKIWSYFIQEKLQGESNSREIAQKLKNCSEKNLIKADKKSVEEFDEFITSNAAYNNYDEVTNAVYKATNAQLNFDNIIENYVIDTDGEKHKQFKDIILRLYNVIAKLVGKDSAASLIFDLKVQKNVIGDKTLAVSIGFPDVTGAGGVAKSCIIYSQVSLNVDETMLFKNYYQNMFWTTDSIFHPFIHEFGHVIDYYLTMTPENRMKLKQGINFVNNHATCQMESNYDITNNELKQNHLHQKSSEKPFSIGADDLKKYLFANVRNHNLPKNNNEMKDLLAYMIVRSDYALTIDPELFAEAFALWMVTGENKRARNWQILNRFFTTFLKKRIDCPYCVVE